MSRTLKLSWTRTEMLYATVQVTEDEVRTWFSDNGEDIGNRPLTDADYAEYAKDGWGYGPEDLDFDEKSGGEHLDSVEIDGAVIPVTL